MPFIINILVNNFFKKDEEIRGQRDERHFCFVTQI
jgi:hypothetical protein